MQQTIFSHSLASFFGPVWPTPSWRHCGGRAHSSRHLHGRPGRVSSSVPVPRTVVELPKSFLEKHHLEVAFKVLKAILVILWPGSAKNSGKLFGKCFYLFYLLPSTFAYGFNIDRQRKARKMETGL
ncbi:hypothetical protein niasHS_004695 [Heterodera schachtii]|uniref:Uncharacterized protein n=1 Tax=Heterodera schachtii TaxID=97005 RepID=A0ABD2JUV2_HETSC